MTYSLKTAVMCLLLSSQTSKHENLQNAVNSKSITFDLQHGSLMSDGSILPGEHRTPTALFGKDQVSLSAASVVEDADVTAKLDDFKDIQIFANVFIGSERKPFQMIFDTGSNWVWVDEKECVNCPNLPRFDSGASTTYSEKWWSKSLYYGSGSVNGQNGFDTVCLTLGRCVDNFSFVAVKSQSGLSSIRSSGLVGLSPYKFDADSDLFIAKMKEAGTIDSAIFSLSIGMGNKQSKITFGGYDTAQFATGPIVWHDISRYSIYWQLPLDHFGFSVGGKHFELGHNRGLVVDSGTSFLLMPVSDQHSFVKHLEEETGLSCQTRVVPICDCTVDQYKKLPDLRFVIEGITYHVPSESYVLYDWWRGQCGLKIMSNPGVSKWILGLNFFENYYTVFDQENLRVGLAPSIHAQERLRVLSMASPPVFSKQNNVQIITGVSIVLFVIACGLMVKVSKGRKENNSHYQSLQMTVPK